MSGWTRKKRGWSRFVSVTVLVAMLLATTGIGYAAPKANVDSRRAPVVKTEEVPAAPDSSPEEASAEVVLRAPRAKVPAAAPDGGLAADAQDAASVIVPACHGWIHVYKFEDHDGDQKWDEDEPPIEGWKFTVSKVGRVYNLVTDASGHAVVQAATGIWTVTEEMRQGWSWVLPKIIRVDDGENERLYFGNHHWRVTKTVMLEYPMAPEGSSFKVTFDFRESRDVEVPLSFDPASGKWVGEQEVCWKEPFTIDWWMMGPMYEGPVLLGSTGRECLDRDADNLFEYDSSICGTKFEDVDGDGVRDEGEQGLPGWVIHLYPEREIVLANGDAWIAEAVTDEDGRYCFSQVPPGLYRVEEVLQTGWEQTVAPMEPVMVGDGTHATGFDFGNMRIGVVKKFELKLDVAKPDVTYSAEYTVNGEPMVTDLLSDGDPLMFEGAEDLMWGDVLGAVAWYAHYGGEHIWLGSTDGEVLEQLETVNSFHYDPIVGGHKFNDLDGDGIWDQNEPGLEGWTIQLWRTPAELPNGELRGTATAELYAQTVTDEDGSYYFEGALPGEYMVTEVLQPGWAQTLSPDGSFMIANGTDIGSLDFGNMRLYPDLMIEKSVEPTLAAREDIVTYTLTWSNVGDYMAEDYTITDDFDERYMAVVDSGGGVVADGKITWTIAGPIDPGDPPLTVSYALQVLATVPEDVTVVENTVVISHPEDTDPSNDSDDASVEIEPFAPFTEPTPEEDFLPFTGSEIALLLFAAAVSGTIGLLLRRRSA